MSKKEELRKHINNTLKEFAEGQKEIREEDDIPQDSVDPVPYNPDWATDRADLLWPRK